MEKPNGTGLMRIVKATRCSLDGISFAWHHESAFRQELMLSLLLIPTALWLSEDTLQLVLLLMPLLLLLVVECLNSAIEAAIDRISTELHPLSKQAKDLGSAAVFFCLILVLLTWLGIAYNNLWQSV